VIDTVLGRDKDFLSWRVDHPGSFVPRSATTSANGHHRSVTPKPMPATAS